MCRLRGQALVSELPQEKGLPHGGLRCGDSPGSLGPASHCCVPWPPPPQLPPTLRQPRWPSFVSQKLGGLNDQKFFMIRIAVRGGRSCFSASLWGDSSSDPGLVTAPCSDSRPRSPGPLSHSACGMRFMPVTSGQSSSGQKPPFAHAQAWTALPRVQHRIVPSFLMATGVST